MTVKQILSDCNTVHTFTSNHLKKARTRYVTDTALVPGWNAALFPTWKPRPLKITAEAETTSTPLRTHSTTRSCMCLSLGEDPPLSTTGHFPTVGICSTSSPSLTWQNDDIFWGLVFTAMLQHDRDSSLKPPLGFDLQHFIGCLAAAILTVACKESSWVGILADCLFLINQWCISTMTIHTVSNKGYIKGSIITLIALWVHTCNNIFMCRMLRLSKCKLTSIKHRYHYWNYSTMQTRLPQQTQRVWKTKLGMTDRPPSRLALTAGLYSLYTGS